jgi:hypothetical protein
MTAKQKRALERAVERRGELRKVYDALPDPNEQTSVNAVQRAWEAQRRVSVRISELARYIDTIKQVEPDRDALRATRDDLLAAEQAMKKRQADLIDDIALATDGRVRDRLYSESQSVQAAIDAIHNGVTRHGSLEGVPTPLAVFLRDQRGWKPGPGDEGIWRGSLRYIESRLAELDPKIAEAYAVIDAELARPIETPLAAAS